MERNVGGLDRTLRLVVATCLLVVGYRNRSSSWGTLAFVGGSDILATALIQRCPANALFGVDTCPAG